VPRVAPARSWSGCSTDRPYTLAVLIVWEVVGWGGAVLLVTAYALVATHRLDARSKTYHLMNLGAAVLLTVYSIVKFAWAQVALNAFWGAVAVIGIILAITAARGLTTAAVEPGVEPGVEPVREG